MDSEKRVETAEDLGQAIRARRKVARLTQRDAAALAGVGTRFLSELERGKPTSEIGKILTVLQMLGLELSVTSRD